MLKFSMNEIEKLYAAISAVRRLYLPVEKDGEVSFGVYGPDSVVRLDVLKTVKSAKEAFFPQTENLMKMNMVGKKITIEPPKDENEDFVIMGVRACDAKSFEILDRVYLSQPVDCFYAARRQHGLVVTLACSRPEESCFCKAFGIDAAEPAGDVVTYIADGTLYWEAKTEKGAAFTEEIRAAFAEADVADEKTVEEQKEAVRAIIDRLPFANLSLKSFEDPDWMKKFNSPRWKELSKACLGCGTCTFVCPTCQCYDVRDYDTGHGVERYRCWDSCMFSDFTMMAHGNNRNSQVERFRQRFMHKLVYYPNNNEGIYSCVGCGRCVNKCPMSLNIVKVIKALSEEE